MRSLAGPLAFALVSVAAAAPLDHAALSRAIGRAALPPRASGEDTKTLEDATGRAVDRYRTAQEAAGAHALSDESAQLLHRFSDSGVLLSRASLEKALAQLRPATATLAPDGEGYAIVIKGRGGYYSAEQAFLFLAHRLAALVVRRVEIGEDEFSIEGTLPHIESTLPEPSAMARSTESSRRAAEPPRTRELRSRLAALEEALTELGGRRTRAESAEHVVDNLKRIAPRLGAPAAAVSAKELIVRYRPVLKTATFAFDGSDVTIEGVQVLLPPGGRSATPSPGRGGGDAPRSGDNKPAPLGVLARDLADQLGWTSVQSGAEGGVYKAHLRHEAAALPR